MRLNLGRIALVPPVLLLCLAPPPPPGMAQSSANPPPRPCTAPEHRQFDFWVGQWEVHTPDGKRAGANRIRPILDGCVLHESWTGAGGSNGTSYNVYDQTRKRWHQTWVDNQGSLLQLDGTFRGGRMKLEGETRDSSGGRVLQRITWEQTAPKNVRQLWEVSSDGGGSWRVVFDGRYVKQ